LKSTTIAFIGAGNMAQCLIGGMIAGGVSPSRLWATNRSDDLLTPLKQLGIHTTTDNKTAASVADVIVLAVKPNSVHAVAVELLPIIQTKQLLVISIAAGIRASTLQQWLGKNTPIVRAMPNTPALLRAGVTGLYATGNANAADRQMAEDIMSAVGTCVWLDKEHLMDVLTAVSGCGPAYFFLVMEAMEKAAKELGLSSESVHLLTVQTAIGAAKMADQPNTDPAALRRQVTSPNGVTECAIQIFEQGGLVELFQKALSAAVARSEEMADQLSQAPDQS
jgi:pyrroline-5-carboxylate reductase